MEGKDARTFEELDRNLVEVLGMGMGRGESCLNKGKNEDKRELMD